MFSLVKGAGDIHTEAFDFTCLTRTLLQFGWWLVIILVLVQCFQSESAAEVEG